MRPSVRPSIRLSVRPFVRPSVRPCVRPSVCPSVRPSVRPFVRPSVRPCVRPSVHPSVCPSVHVDKGRLEACLCSKLHIRSLRCTTMREILFAVFQFHADHFICSRMIEPSKQRYITSAADPSTSSPTTSRPADEPDRHRRRSHTHTVRQSGERRLETCRFACSRVRLSKLTSHSAMFFHTPDV